MRPPIVPGVSLADAQRRLHGSSLWLPYKTAMPSASSNPTWAAPQSDATTAHTVGAWAVISSALAADATLLQVMIGSGGVSQAGINTSTLLEVGTGGAGAETSRFTLNVSQSEDFDSFWVPCGIPSGTRVVVRIQSAVTSKSVNVGIAFYGQQGLVPAQIMDPVLMGFDTSVSNGTLLSVPGGTNTEGTPWVELEDSTTQTFCALLPMFTITGADTTWGAGNVFGDIGIGAASAEAALITDRWFQRSSNEVINRNDQFPEAVWIPQGSRISARYQTSSVNDTTMACCLGIPAISGW